MLAVADQLPAAALADDATGPAAIASTAQIVDAATLILTITPLVSPRSTSRAYAGKAAQALQDP
jgi:hypothetical protein